MPKITFSIKIEEELIKYIKQQAREKNIEISEFIREAIEHYQSCKVKEKAETKEASLKLIVTKYDGKCSKCSNYVPMGSLAYFGKSEGSTILICLDCMVENKSDKALASRYLKMRELDKTVRALRKEAEYLASKLEDLQAVQKFDNIYDKINETIKLVMNYLRTPIIKEDEKKALEELIRFIEDGKRAIKDVEDFIQNRIRIPKKIKQEYRE